MPQVNFRASSERLAVIDRAAAIRVGRNMSDPVPVILLGQLAVDEAYRGRRLGSDLLIDAARRSLTAAGVIGARAFCEKFGFRPFSDREPLMLVLSMSEIEGLLRPWPMPLPGSPRCLPDSSAP